LPFAAAAEPTYRVRVPKAFYDDHVARDLPAGKQLRTLAREYEVELTKAEYDELLGDARHYADPDAGFDERGMLGLKSSARATVKRLEAAQPVASEVQQTGRLAP